MNKRIKKIISEILKNISTFSLVIMVEGIFLKFDALYLPTDIKSLLITMMAWLIFDVLSRCFRDKEYQKSQPD